MAITMTVEADSPTRKRAFVADDTSSYAFPPTPKKVEFCLPSIQLVSPSPNRPTSRSTNTGRRRKSSIDKTGRQIRPHQTSMQAPPSPRTFAAPMPSFMTVFDEASTRREFQELADRHASATEKVLPSNNPATTETGFSHINRPFASFHQQRDSISTSASESSDSSPTTTVSTLDSSSITEPSPGASPESPALNSSPISYTMDASRFSPPERTHTEPMRPPFFEMQRPTTPAKKPRNLKNLAVNTTSAYNLGRAIMSAPFAPPVAKAPERTSAPSSPSFVKPPTPPRRKLANVGLTIKTTSNNTGSGITRVAVPPTPSMTRPNTLRHFQSSPSLPLCTPGLAPSGGMSLPPLRVRHSPRGFADILQEDEEEETEPNFDVPQSQEEKPESYPNGPIRIYESGIDLYYEPNVEVASKYDVIFNVASEVKNPFVEAARAAGQPQLTSNIGILAEGSEAAASPDTPKATPISAHTSVNGLIPTSSSDFPEYIHIPWEHNTDIVPDLPRLVKLIDDRVQQGKRVLVHCQCGVSRSASLIVAYGLYKNPGISVQEAYDAVKKRSKWIGPNMNLIMQLQEFRSGLLRNNRREHGFQSQLFTLPRKLSTTLSSASTSGSFDLGSGSASGPVTPRTAPLPPEREQSPNRARTSSMGPFSAAPVEPRESPYWEPGFRRSWGSGEVSSDLGLNRVSIVSDTPYVDPKGHVVPMVTVIQQDQNASPTEEEQKARDLAQSKSLKRKTPNFSRQLPLRKDYDMDSPMAEAPALPSSISPRAEEFHMVGIERDVVPLNDDSFGILSPIVTEFPKNPFEKAEPTPEEQTGFSFFPIVARKTAEPKPFSVGSPTSTEFPQGFPFRNDLLQPTPPSSSSLRSNALKPLRTKFSSPNLQEARRLQQMQNEIEAALPSSASPKRHFDDLDALMSPRATEFTVNPFHDLLSVKPANLQAEKPTPVTPTSSDVDPRSPAQHGISPITRNIFDVL